MLDENVIAKLTPEQLKIALRWEEERTKRSFLIDKLSAGTISYEDFNKSMSDITPSYCEHGRFIMGTCAGCDAIERIVRPDAFEDEE